MSSTLDIEAIKLRGYELAKDEDICRDYVLMSGAKEWPLGDKIRATLGDVSALVEEVHALRAELAKREPEADPLRAALIGILRADGYVIHEPAWGDGSTVAGVEVGAFDPDAAASDMLGEDAPVTGYDPRPDICSNCEQPLTPDGKCRSPYVDCQRGPSDTERPAALLPPGESVRIVADGPWHGRFAIVETHEPGKPPSVVVIAKGAQLANAVDLDHVLVVNPDVDEPTKAEAPAAKARQRAPEPPKLVTEWSPDGRDFEGYAKDLGCTVVTAMTMAAEFKREVAGASPDKKLARWGGTFKEWAKARLANQA